MTSRDFVYWLQGMFELGGPKALDERQTELVKRHLALVFKHDIDPSAGPPDVQTALNDIHEGKVKSTALDHLGKKSPDGLLIRC